MLRRLDLRFRFSQVVLKGRDRQQFADDRLPKDAACLNIRQEMLADKHAIPTDVPADSQNSVRLSRKEFRQQKRVNCAPRGMSAWVAATGFRVAQRKMLVQFIRTLSFPVILGDIDDLTDLCFN